MGITKRQIAQFITAQKALVAAVKEDVRLTVKLEMLETQINNTRRRRDLLQSDYNTQIDLYQREREETERRYAESQRTLMECERAMATIYEELAENGE